MSTMPRSMVRRNELTVSPRRSVLLGIEGLSTWIGVPWYTFALYQFTIVFGYMLQEVLKPAIVLHKIPLLHHLFERKNEAKLLRHLDVIVTNWNDEVDPSAIDDAICRTQLNL